MAMIEQSRLSNNHERLLPCKCGCRKREHWYSGDKQAPEQLRCMKCGFSVCGKNSADARRQWNEAVRAIKRERANAEMTSASIDAGSQRYIMARLFLQQLKKYGTYLKAQEYKTLKGQALSGDVAGAEKSLNTILERVQPPRRG